MSSHRLMRWRRKLRQHWFGLLALVLTSALIYIVVYHIEDDVRNVYLSMRFSASFMFVPDPKDSSSVDCSALVQGKKGEILKARLSREEPSLGGVPTPGQSCENFKKRRKYILNVTQGESEFPIAFSLLVYKNSHQVERLLRAVYRPSNIYCIHVDLKSTAMLDEMRRLVDCFDNVFLSSRQVNVRWGEFSVLEAELVCMEDLMKSHTRWRYFINLTGQEYPLKTNWQLVQILKTYQGSNDVSGTVTRYSENIRRFWRAGPVPHNLTSVIGSVHVIVNRHFVNFSVSDPKAHDLKEWLKHTEIPDETYFPTLNYNPQLGIPGTFKGAPREEPFLARYKNWDHGLMFYKDDCQGRYHREICILGVGDLPSLVKRKHLFANKLEEDFQPAAYNCLEQWYVNMTLKENHGEREFDTSYYSKLDFVLNQVGAR